MSCIKCDEVVDKAQQHRRRVRFEVLAELDRIRDYINSLDKVYDKAEETMKKELPVLTSRDYRPTDITDDILRPGMKAIEKDYSCLWYVIRDYQASIRENLDAILHRDLCNLYGLAVPHEQESRDPWWW